MRVLGIDPGITNTGFGVVQQRGSRLFALDGGVIKTGAQLALEQRLAQIANAITELIERYEPASLAVESLYFGRNVQTAFAVGQARGTVLTAAGLSGTTVFSYTPQQIKQAVCGSGGAQKEQVRRMVCSLLGLSGRSPRDHTADALAAAICQINCAPLQLAKVAAG